jgi:protein gp37
MALAPQHTFQVLTKRPERAATYLAGMGDAGPLDIFVRGGGRLLKAAEYATRNSRRFEFQPVQRWPLRNVWLGTSISDQASADQRIPHLLATPAAVRFISAEPLLGPVDLETAWHGETALAAECWGDCGWCDAGYPALHNCQRGKQSGQEYSKGQSGIDWVIVGGESGPHARPMHPDWARSLRDQCAVAGVPFLFKQWGEWAPTELSDEIDARCCQENGNLWAGRMV